MTCVECGLRWKEVDWKAIWQGYDLAWPGRRAQPSPLSDEVYEELSAWDEYRDW